MARGLEGVNPRLVDQHMRVVLPKNVADALHVRQGDYVTFIISGSEVKIRKVKLSLD